VVIGEVVPAREGLRHKKLREITKEIPEIGEVVPAREGLRPFLRICCDPQRRIGEVVPAREGLRPERKFFTVCIICRSEKWFQQEKD